MKENKKFNPWEIAKQKWEQANVQRKKLKEQKARNLRIEDMYEQNYSYGKITLPYPNAFINDIITKYFSELEGDDNIQDIGIIIYLLENSKDTSLRNLSKEELQERGDARLTEIPAGMDVDYKIAIDEMFATIKKKVSSLQMKEIAKLAQSLDGETFASALQKNLANQ